MLPRDRADHHAGDDGTARAERLLVARQRLPRQRCTVFDARVDHLLAVEVTQQDVDAGEAAHALGLLVEARIVAIPQAGRSRKRLRGVLQTGDITVDGERELARVVLQIGFDARKFGIVIAEIENGREDQHRHHDGERQQHQVAADGQTRDQIVLPFPHARSGRRIRSRREVYSGERKNHLFRPAGPTARKMHRFEPSRRACGVVSRLVGGPGCSAGTRTGPVASMRENRQDGRLLLVGR